MTMPQAPWRSSNSCAWWTSKIAGCRHRQWSVCGPRCRNARCGSRPLRGASSGVYAANFEDFLQHLVGVSRDPLIGRHGAIRALVPVDHGIAPIGDSHAHDAIPRLVVVAAGESIVARGVGIEVVMATLITMRDFGSLPPLVSPLEVVASGEERKAGRVAEVLPAIAHPVRVRLHRLSGNLSPLTADPHGIRAAPFGNEQRPLNLLPVDQELLVLLRQTGRRTAIGIDASRRKALRQVLLEVLPQYGSAVTVFIAIGERVVVQSRQDYFFAREAGSSRRICAAIHNGEVMTVLVIRKRSGVIHLIAEHQPHHRRVVAILLRQCTAVLDVKLLEAVIPVD